MYGDTYWEMLIRATAMEHPESASELQPLSGGLWMLECESAIRDGTDLRYDVNNFS